MRDRLLVDLRPIWEPLMVETAENPFLGTDLLSPFLRYGRRFLAQEAQWRLFILATADLLYLKIGDSVALTVTDMVPLIPIEIATDPFSAQSFEFAEHPNGVPIIRSPYCFQNGAYEEASEWSRAVCGDSEQAEQKLQVVRFIQR